MSHLQYFLLYGVDPVFGDALRRELRAAVLFINADQYVTAAEIVKIVREGTDRAQDSFGIPPGFELKAFPFHGMAPQKRVDGHGQGQ